MANREKILHTCVTAWSALYRGDEVPAAYEQVTRLFNEILDEYAAPSRCYHNLDHLDSVTTRLRVMTKWMAGW